jgi:polysaccharide biosynthesis/export protein
MKIRAAIISILLLSGSLMAQQNTATEMKALPGSPAEEILLKQLQNRQDQQNSTEKLNERMILLTRHPKTISDYFMGPGDVIELTVVGIPGLDKKLFSLDGQGAISVPYVGQVELLGLTTRDAENKLVRLFAVSVLEDPQVNISVREYKSQFFYVIGAVKQAGKFPITQSIDLLDALAVAGGLTDRAVTDIRIYRNAQSKAVAGNPTGMNAAAASAPLEVNLSELLRAGQISDRMPIFSGDVIEVQEKKERVFYVLGDISKPGAFTMDSSKRMSLSRALANAGGLMKTASGKKALIIRQKDDGSLPDQIQVNANSVLSGKVKDVELCENDIVLVPGSSSKTLGKNFLAGVSGLLGTLIYIATR